MTARRLAVLWLLAVPAAEAAHITDKLAVGLYASAADEQPMRILTSGTPLEVLDRGGRLCRIRLGDRTEGWLECRYVTDEKPARSMLVEAQANASRLRRHIAELQADCAATQTAAPGLDLRPVSFSEKRTATPPAPSQAWLWPGTMGAGLGLLMGGLIGRLRRRG